MEAFSLEHLWIRTNLSFLLRYWKTATEALDRVSAAPDTFEEFKIAGTDPPGYVEAILASHKEQHCYAGILVTYALLDELMTTLAKRMGQARGAKIAPSDLKDRGMRRYEKYVCDVCGVDRDKIKIDWSFLHDFSIIRNALIHANGNTSLLSNPKHLARLVEKYPNELSFRHKTKLVIDEEFVARCIVTTSVTADRMNSYLYEKVETVVPKGGV